MIDYFKKQFPAYYLFIAIGLTSLIFYYFLSKQNKIIKENTVKSESSNGASGENKSNGTTSSNMNNAGNSATENSSSSNKTQASSSKNSSGKNKEKQVVRTSGNRFTKPILLIETPSPDEEHNIFWANKMQEEGAKVIFTSPKQKVHCKLCLIKRIEKKKPVYYLQCGTGNYNADTSKVYSDVSLFTCNTKLTHDAIEIFKYLTTSNYKPKTSHILPAPFGLKEKLLALIDHEIAIAKKGRDAFIYAKLNSLSDTQLIERLYKASRAGVRIKLIVRGICCLVPENKIWSKNIECKSIVGRYLEHSRFFIFGNDKDSKVFISSADWMERNFYSRVETVIPILNKKIKKQLSKIFDLQWNDNVQARHMDLPNYNKLYDEGSIKINSQMALFDLLK